MRSTLSSLAGVFLLSLVAIGAKKDPTPIDAKVPDDFVSHSASGMDVKTPANWKDKASTTPPIVLTFLADDGICNLNIGMVAEAMTDRDPDNIGKQVAAGMAGRVENFVLKTTESVLVAGEDSPRLVYEGSVSGVKFRGQQTYVSKGGKTFIVTFTAPVESFDKYAGTFDQILASIKIAP